MTYRVYRWLRRPISSARDLVRDKVWHFRHKILAPYIASRAEDSALVKRFLARLADDLLLNDDKRYPRALRIAHKLGFYTSFHHPDMVERELAWQDPDWYYVATTYSDEYVGGVCSVILYT